MKLSQYRGKVAGALYGFMVGDAMGASTEFMSQCDIQNEYGEVNDIIGGGYFKWQAGHCTDDTDMMLCVANALEGVILQVHSSERDIRDHFLQKCGSNFVKWYETDPKDVGNTCASGIRNFAATGKFTAYNSNTLGNGSLMRALPCALLGLDDFNEIQSKITHNSEGVLKVIQMYSEDIKAAMYGNPMCHQSKGLRSPLGDCYSTYNNVIWWVSQGHCPEYRSFEDCIVGAVNDGGDSDTIAAIAGGLSGAYWGIEHIPSRWIEKILAQYKDEADKFIEFATNYIISSLH